MVDVNGQPLIYFRVTWLRNRRHRVLERTQDNVMHRNLTDGRLGLSRNGSGMVSDGRTEEHSKGFPSSLEKEPEQVIVGLKMEINIFCMLGMILNALSAFMVMGKV